MSVDVLYETCPPCGHPVWHDRDPEAVLCLRCHQRHLSWPKDYWLPRAATTADHRAMGSWQSMLWMRADLLERARHSDPVTPETFQLLRSADAQIEELESHLLAMPPAYEKL